MSTAILSPTPEFAWIAVFDNAPELPRIRVEYEDGNRWYPSTCEHDYELCQWHEDGYGGGQWIRVPVIERP